MLFTTVNEDGQKCILAAILFGACGYFLGMRLDMPLSVMFAGVGLGFFLPDLFFRLASFCAQPSLLVLFSPHRGGHYGYLPCYLIGILFLLLAGYSYTQAQRISTEETRRADSKKEAERVERITAKLPRGGFSIEVTDRRGTFSVLITNLHKLDFTHVKLTPRFTEGTRTINQKLDWPSWKIGETKELRLPPALSGLTFFSFDFFASAAIGPEEYFTAVNAGHVKDMKFVPLEVK